MKEEIKEILDNPTTTDECYDGRIIEIDRGYDLDLDEIKLLLDYITNLQEENERYKKRFENLKKEYIEKIDRTNELQQRTDKAIEYIKQQDMSWYGEVVNTKLDCILNILERGK